MTHDTPEAVEAMVEEMHFTVSDLPTEIGCMAAAAMLRRLHQRAVDAERERDELQGLLVTHEICADRIKATARADALREAVPVAAALNASISLLERGGKKAAASDKMFAQMLLDYRAALEAFRALINKEPRHD